MKNNCHKLFDKLEDVQPSADFYNNVRSSLLRHTINNTRRKIVVFGFLSFASFAVLPLMISNLLASFYNSGFYSYLSLMFSDTQYVVRYWQEYFLSLAESLPTSELLTFFAASFVFLLALKFSFKYVKIQNNYLVHNT